MSLHLQLSEDVTLQQIREAMKLLGTSTFTFNITESDKPSFLVKAEKQEIVELENPAGENIEKECKVQTPTVEKQEPQERIERKPDEKDEQNEYDVECDDYFSDDDLGPTKMDMGPD